jgi:MoaA/NifB/PqqE/SkfB family radical SAM enzyme
MEYLVEHSAEFYYKIHSEVFNDRCNAVLFDVTDKCNLNCKHCYHLPDDNTPDIAELIQEIKKVFKRPVGMLTNGVKFSDKDFTKLMADSGIGGTVLLGINCDSDDKLKTKQLKGLSNLYEFGLLPKIGYTASNYECLDQVIQEVQELYESKILISGYDNVARVRFGSDIGRNTHDEQKTLSKNLEAVKKSCKNLKLSYSELLLNNTIGHQCVLINGKPLRVIHWQDARTITMEEFICGPWARFLFPITNFVHQIILRDGLVNKNLPRLDLPPEKYILK